MGVLTSSQFDRKKKSDGVVRIGKTQGPAIYEPGRNVICMYRFPPAPMGECNAFHAYLEKDYKLPLVDQVFTFPKQWSGKKKQFYMKMLVDLGWENVSETAKPPVKTTTEYFLAHPENTDSDLINATIYVTVGKKEIELECEEGMITTTKKNVYQALIKKGYLEAKAPRVKEA